MLIKYLGHSCFYLKSHNGISVLTDPYKPGAYGGAIAYQPITDVADICVITHEHEDHANSEGLPNRPLTVTNGAMARNIEFDAIETFHDDVQGQERGSNRVFCFAMDDIRICHLGDLGHLLSPQQVDEIGMVDLLFIPVGGGFTIGPSEADQVIEQLHPKVVVPMHFKTDKCKFEIEPVDTFLQGKQKIRRSPPAR